jgi:regulatory protein
MSPKAPVSAWWKAQELLARRAHGKQELINKLKLRDYPAVEIDAAITRLIEKKYLDDEAFARDLTAELFFRRGYGFYVILLRLRRKGLDADLCEKVVKSFFAEIDAEAMAAQILKLVSRRRAREKDRNRLFVWLQQRGFRADEITRALQNYELE